MVLNTLCFPSHNVIIRFYIFGRAGPPSQLSLWNCHGVSIMYHNFPPRKKHMNWVYPASRNLTSHHLGSIQVVVATSTCQWPQFQTEGPPHDGTAIPIGSLAPLKKRLRFLLNSAQKGSLTIFKPFFVGSSTGKTYTLWLFHIAMGNGPFIDGLPKNGDFPWLC